MCRNLSWNDVVSSFAPHDRERHAEATDKMKDEVDRGNIKEAKKIAEYIQRWEEDRWNVAEANMIAAKRGIN